MATPLDLARRYRGDPQRTELDAALLVADLLGAPPDRDRVHRALADVADGLTYSVDALVERIETAGFSGPSDYRALELSRIDRVLETRRGIPITLAVVYIEVGRRAGLDAHGVGFPGHFLVEVERAIVDPFANRRLDEAGLVRLATAQGVDAALDTLLERSPPDAMALRMINNVKGVLFATRGEAAVPEVLDLIDCQLALGGDPTALELERAQWWARLRSVEGIRTALEAARATCTDAALAGEIERRLAGLPAGGSSSLH